MRDASVGGVLPAQSERLNQLVGDAANAAENLDRKIKANTPPAELVNRGGPEVTELLRIVSELNRLNADQQKTIHELTSKPKRNGLMERVVTVVGIASTLLTMMLALRKDRREIQELRAELAKSSTITAVQPSSR